MNNATKNRINSEKALTKSALPLFQVAKNNVDTGEDKDKTILNGTKVPSFSVGAASAPLFITAENSSEVKQTSSDSATVKFAEVKSTMPVAPLFQSATESPVYAVYLQKREEKLKERAESTNRGSLRSRQENLLIPSEEDTKGVNKPNNRKENLKNYVKNIGDREENPYLSKETETSEIKGRNRSRREEDAELLPNSDSSVSKSDNFLSDYEAYVSDSLHEVDGTHRRRRRRARGEENTLQAPEQISQVKGSTRLEAKKLRRLEGRKEGRRRKAITESEFLARRESVKRKMIIRAQDGLNQIAVLEDNILVEHYVSRRTQTTMVGSIYQGKVQNVLPSMEAAFVDLGKGRNAVLYAGEVNWDAAGLKGRPRRIEQALKPGDTVTVQVTKDPIGHKGARLTSQLTLPGRYLVLVPGGSMTGISRKLPEEERRRLKKIMRRIIPKDFGVIIRTAAEGATEEQISQDVERLQKQWDKLQQKLKSSQSAPYNLYAEPELSLRVVRDIFNEDFEKLIIQGKDSYRQVVEYVKEFAPELVDRVELWVEREDIFSANRVDEQLAKGMDRKVWLPSGGYLIIDRTEAMTVIDVNTGKFTGTGGTLEETVTRNNLEAAEEIMRQLRLRDIGGIVVIDFVDMVLESNRELVLRRLVECLGRDRTRHQVTEVTSLGLVQMTRKRVGEGLVEAFSTTCDCCDGRGFIVHSSPVEKDGKPAGAANRETRKSIAKVMAASKSEPANKNDREVYEENSSKAVETDSSKDQGTVLAAKNEVSPANRKSETGETGVEKNQRSHTSGKLVREGHSENKAVRKARNEADSHSDRELSASLQDNPLRSNPSVKNEPKSGHKAKNRTAKHLPVVWSPSAGSSSGVVTVGGSKPAPITIGNDVEQEENLNDQTETGNSTNPPVELQEQESKTLAKPSTRKNGAKNGVTRARGTRGKTLKEPLESQASGTSIETETATAGKQIAKDKPSKDSSKPAEDRNKDNKRKANKHRAVILPVSTPKAEKEVAVKEKEPKKRAHKLTKETTTPGGSEKSSANTRKNDSVDSAEPTEKTRPNPEKSSSGSEADNSLKSAVKAPKRIRIAKKAPEEKPKVKPLNQQEAALSVREALTQANMLLSVPSFSLKASNNAFGIPTPVIDTQVEQAAAEAKKARKNRGKKRGAARS